MASAAANGRLNRGTKTVIEFREVSKVYPDGTVAVDSVSFSVAAGTVLALVGTSGSGKTTLLRMVNRMVEPTSGTVLLGDRDVSQTNPVALRRSIGYVLQEGGLLPHRTVADNVVTVPVLRGSTRRAARTAVAGLLERVGLDPALGSRYPSQLSGGQRQRVGVARALAADPEVLLMDEPFGAVDPIVRRDLQDELRRLQADLGKTVLVVTHDVDEAFRVGDEVIVLDKQARIAQRGTPAQILAAPADDFVRRFIGADGGERELRVVEQAGGRAVVVDELQRPLGVLAP